MPPLPPIFQATGRIHRGPVPAFGPQYPPILFWPSPSPPVSPTNYYNHANVGGIPQMSPQAMMTPPECLQLGPTESRVDATIPMQDIENRNPMPSYPGIHPAYSPLECLELLLI